MDRFYILRMSRDGSMMIDEIKASTPLTAMPRMRKGSNTSHTMGYRTSARSASGQHKTNKMHHSRNFTIGNCCKPAPV